LVTFREAENSAPDPCFSTFLITTGRLPTRWIRPWANPLPLKNAGLWWASGLNCCNVELRPKGIIIRFRSLLETFALVIPYYKLSIYKGEAAIHSIFADHHFIKVRSDTMAIKKFFRKLMDYKADNTPTTIDDL